MNLVNQSIHGSLGLPIFDYDIFNRMKKLVFVNN